VFEKSPSERWRHDLKNQLGIVLGYSDLMLADMDDADPLRADLEEIRKAGQQAMALVVELGESD
jgi:signal transduction histidine kinase